LSETKRQVLEMKPVVLDTNVVLDMFVFNDPASNPLKAGLETGALQWIATMQMRDELERVLSYPHIKAKLAFYEIAAAAVLAQFDGSARIEPAAPKAAVTCKDADDQKFIDLAVSHQAMLLSKDNAVLCMKKRLLSLAVVVQVAMSGIAAAT
jgi:putative PIN family toxin of toxin-antitoxin system